MNPTQTLMNEHRLIEKVLGVLDAVATGADGGALPQATAADILTFLRELADRCHHGKEEKHLFPRLTAYGYTTQTGPVAVMLHEHEIGRGFIREMAGALEANAADRFAAAAHGYVTLLQGHIQKEDQILFRIADQVFSETDQREVAEGFERVELEDMGPGAHEKLHALAERILSGAVR